jgi:CRP-like cAMP-binding protein
MDKTPIKMQKKRVNVDKVFLKDTKGDISHVHFQIEPLPEYFKSISRLHNDRSSLGERKTILTKGMSFGQLGLLTRRRRSATIISEGCEVLILDKIDYDRIIKPSQIGKNSSKYGCMHTNA